MKGLKRVAWLVLIALVIGLLAGCGQEKERRESDTDSVRDGTQTESQTENRASSDLDALEQTDGEELIRRSVSHLANSVLEYGSGVVMPYVMAVQRLAAMPSAEVQAELEIRDVPPLKGGLLLDAQGNLACTLSASPDVPGTTDSELLSLKKEEERLLVGFPFADAENGSEKQTFYILTFNDFVFDPSSLAGLEESLSGLLPGEASAFAEKGTGIAGKLLGALEALGKAGYSFGDIPEVLFAHLSSPTCVRTEDTLTVGTELDLSDLPALSDLPVIRLEIVYAEGQERPVRYGIGFLQTSLALTFEVDEFGLTKIIRLTGLDESRGGDLFELVVDRGVSGFGNSSVFVSFSLPSAAGNPGTPALSLRADASSDGAGDRLELTLDTAGQNGSPFSLSLNYENAHPAGQDGQISLRAQGRDAQDDPLFSLSATAHAADRDVELTVLDEERFALTEVRTTEDLTKMAAVMLKEIRGLLPAPDVSGNGD